MAQTPNLRYLWTSIWLMAGTLIGLAFVIWYSYCNGCCTGFLLLWSMSYLVIGGLLGFIFSVPKLITESNAITTGESIAVSAARNKIKFQENTNLTQISDWLTKILIGAGLVQLKDIPRFILHVATIMGKGIEPTSILKDVGISSTAACAAIILYFITWGFICGYLVMKLVLTDQFADTVNDKTSDD